MEKVLNYIEKYYYKPLGLILGFPVIFFGLFLPINNLLDNENILTFPLRLLLVYGVLAIIWLVAWLILHFNLPSNKQKKIGIILCIDAENEKQKTRIKKDFIENLRKELNEHGLLDLFYVVVLKDYQAERAIKILNNYNQKKDSLRRNEIDVTTLKKAPKEVKKWKAFNKKVQCHFYIWGSIRKRYDVEQKYFIETNALVRHVPVGFSISDEIKKNFKDIYGRVISFDEKIEYVGFKLTADIIYLSARYIIGIASLYSYDPFTALKLHGGLKEEIKSKFTPLPPNLVNVSNNLNYLLSREYYLIASIKYRVQKNIQDAITFIEKSLSMHPKYYPSLIMKAVLFFSLNRDVTETMSLLIEAKKYAENDYTWQYNIAFINMYTDEFEKGLRQYKKLFASSFKDEEKIVDECITFNNQLFIQEPDKKQTLFICGLLYYKKKDNYPPALEFFEKFENECEGTNKYDYLLIRSHTYISELRREMGL